MPPAWKSHVVLRDSIEHALLASALVDTPRTRRQLLVIAIRDGLRLYDDPTVTTALRRLKVSGLFKSGRSDGYLLHYHLTPQGEQMLKAFTESPA
ncbi:hypothetical protein [Deinococcus rubellus]|uniref:Uncharacterized protein n=1 Tax=Deinococcus rubellus TaxID=1889240 RepID=A0ABY5YI49_9DEIO|nr:hypothetical protein [Deinococcus rubellus]UWX64744.1 hypothetical protein N0D28_03535 [Deinococcus rubellus]